MRSVYLIVGIGSQLGNTVAADLIASGETVRGLADVHEDVTMLYRSGITIVRGNLAEPRSAEPLFYGLTARDRVYVIHCASLVTLFTRYDRRVLEANRRYTENLLRLCRTHSVRKLIYVSSLYPFRELAPDSVTGELAGFAPEAVVALYQDVKREVESMILRETENGLDATILQTSGLIGPNDYGRGHLTQLIIRYLDGTLTMSVDGGYDLVDVRDVSKSVIAATERGRRGERYILSNRFVHVHEFFSSLRRISGGPKLTRLPLWIAHAISPVVEILSVIGKRAPLYTRYALFALRSNARLCNFKARRDLGFTVRPLSETLSDTVQFLRCERKNLFRKRHPSAARA